MTGALAQSAWPFVHPAIAAAAGASALVPILIHLINRRRYRRVQWAAMSFLLAASRRSIRRIRLEQWLLMVLRILVVVLLGLAVARPFFPASPLSALGQVRAHHIILLDNSRSMNAADQAGETGHQRAVGAARRLIDAIPTGDAVSLITLAHPAEAVVDHPSYDRRYLLDKIRKITPTQRSTDTAGGLGLALGMIREGRVAAADPRVYVISDLPAGEWGNGRGRPFHLDGQGRPFDSDGDGRDSASTPTGGDARSTVPGGDVGSTVPGGHVGSTVPGGDARSTAPAVAIARAIAERGTLTLIGVPAKTTDNLAVSRIVPESRLAGPNRPLRVTVEVTNHGTRTGQTATVQLIRDGRIVRRIDFDPIDAGASASVSVPLVFATAGTHTVTARLAPGAPDALADDDERHRSIEVRRSVPVLLVDERPGSGLLDGSAGYLSVALAPKAATGGDSLLEPKVISEPELVGEALAEYDVIALCNVGRLGEATWRRLAAFVDGGGGLLLFPGEQVSEEVYNRLAGPGGVDLLPGVLSPPVGSVERADRYFTFSPEGLTHPIVSEFADVPESGLFLAHVRRYMPIEPGDGQGRPSHSEDGAAARFDEVVLRYAHGPPAVTIRRCGAGHVMWFTTTADMRWNNLPAKGDFVSLMVSSVGFVTPGRGERRNLVVGEPALEPLSARQVGLTPIVSGPAGRSLPGRLVARAEGLDVTFGPIEHAGIWPLALGTEIVHFAANVDVADSRLVSVDEATLIDALGDDVVFLTDAETLVESSAESRTSEFSTITALMVLLLLFAEAFCATRFGTHGGRGRASDSGHDLGGQRRPPHPEHGGRGAFTTPHPSPLPGGAGGVADGRGGPLHSEPGAGEGGDR